MRKAQGFSLVEVILSLGIFAGALSVVALFPMLLGQSRHSVQETKAAWLTRQILSDLDSTTGTLRPLVDRQPSASSQLMLPQLNLNQSAVHVLYYTTEGKPVPATSADAILKAEISVVSPDAALPGLSQIAIRVSGMDSPPQDKPIAFYTKLSQMMTAVAPPTTPPVASVP